MNRKRYFNEIKKRNMPTSIIFKAAQLFDFCGSVLQRDLDEADHLQSQAFHFVFYHSNLLAPVLHL
jgi:hypothetical protein